MKSLRYIFYTLIFLSCSGTSKEQFHHHLNTLAAREAELKCRLQILEDSARGVWDNFNQELSDHFPETTSEYIRTKMLEMRNADLLRMFQTFDSLPESVRLKLKYTEMVDSGIVSELERIRSELDSAQMTALHLYMEIETRFPDSLESFRNLYQRSSSIENCD